MFLKTNELQGVGEKHPGTTLAKKAGMSRVKLAMRVRPTGPLVAESFHQTFLLQGTFCCWIVLNVLFPCHSLFLCSLHFFYYFIHVI